MKPKNDATRPLPFAEWTRFTTKIECIQKRPPLSVAGLFAGVGGIELGLHRAGHETALLCEIEEGAKAVLRNRFSGVPLHEDVTTLRQLPKGIDLLTGGFPCQDLSQAGKTAGIVDGKQSSLIGEVFRLIRKHEMPWVLLENVPFMLKLDSGAAMGVLAATFEQLGYRWAYRVVNSLAFGLPQRRERVLFLASLVGDPREVLFADEVPEPYESSDQVGKLACGFYWTEGIRGLGWAVNSVPTLKGGSSIGIPSPPAIVFPDGRVATPDIRDAERMQGFPPGWTSPAAQIVRDSNRWKLVGNAVTVGVFEWLGKRLRQPDPIGGVQTPGYPMHKKGGWPKAGWNVGSGRFGAEISTYPCLRKIPRLEDWLKYPIKPLSIRATSGFLGRTERSSLRFPPRFLEFLRKYLASLEAPVTVHEH